MLKSKIAISLFLITNFLIVNCDDDKILTPELEATANYKLTFESTWSNITHPLNFPANPHFSGLIGASHNKQVIFWEEGHLASHGIKEMAQAGNKDTLISEIEPFIQMHEANEVLSGGGISLSPGSVTLFFQMSSDFPLVTIVSMLAPSPDWFVGVSALDLTENGKWIEKKIVELKVYDSGTDSGNEYTSPNLETSPPVNISKIEVPPFKVGNNIPYVGTFTFERIN